MADLWEVWVQNAKDSFYEMLRGRLSVLNPERTVVVRGVTRPGLIADENETSNVAGLADCFHLQWSKVTVSDGAMPLVSLSCEVRYETAGTTLNGGLDRGRCLSAMDGELLGALQQAPQNVVKNNYTGLANGGSAVPMSTRVWWSDLALGPIELNADRLTRVGLVEVISYQEAGEL